MKFIIIRCSMPRLVWSTVFDRRFDQISSALMSLHRLRIPERIQFKLAVLVYRVLHGKAPEIPRIPRTVHSAVRRSESIITAICIIPSSSHPASSSFDCWCKGVYGIWASSMEQFAVWHYVYRSASLSSSSKKLFIPLFISRRCSITILSIVA